MNRKILFDAIRRAIRRPFRQSEVDAIDAALDEALAQGGDNSPQDTVRPVRPSPSPTHEPRKIGPRGIALIKRFEGCAKRRADGSMEAYPDPGTGGEPWTIGWGATGHDGSGGRIGPDTVWTQGQCDARLEADLARYAKEVDRVLGNAPTSEAEFDALVSFHYNTGAIGRATLTKRHIAGDRDGAAREFGRWVYAGGRVMKGLARRRAAEAALYRSRE